MLKKLWNRMGSQGPLFLYRNKRFGHNDLTAKHCYFRWSRLMGSKFLIKMTRLQNIRIKRMMFGSLVIFITNFQHIKIRRPWSPEIPWQCFTVRSSWPKLYSYLKHGALQLGAHVISEFSTRTFWHLATLFYTWCVWV